MIIDMRLIDANFVLSRVKPYSPDDENWTATGGTAIRLIHNIINDAPTIDAVPVIRFGEGKWFNTDIMECECDEENDANYVQPGWYEKIYNWDEYGAVGINDEILYWMSLPENPEGCEK